MDALVFEHLRKQAIRTFRVVLQVGRVEEVQAHYWENVNAGGHANFFTIEPSGRHTIHDSFNALEWARVHEQVDDAADQAMQQLAAHAQAGERVTTPRTERAQHAAIRPQIRKRGSFVH